ncbi:MAG: sigma-70 family RNA polymerase sigma factor [Polyangiaceae bacterium]
MARADDPLELLSELALTERARLAAAARSEGATAEEALECVQDALCTFLRLEREDALPPSRGEQIAALFTMVRNGVKNLRRRHHRRLPHEPIEELDVSAELPSPEELLGHAEETVRLRACITELCGVQRAVVTLRLLEERSGEDVAAALGLSRGHVDVIVHRARGALRACMRHPGRARSMSDEDADDGSF